MKKKIIIISFILIMIDQIIKVVISNLIPLNSNIKIIPNFFYMANVHNEGAAFSILSGNRFILLLISFVALFIIYKFFIKDKDLTKYDMIMISMLYGGIIGNFIDRIIYGHVIDYLEFIIINYNYPIFNFADICIVVSVIGIVIKSIWEDVCKSSKSKKKQDA